MSRINTGMQGVNSVRLKASVWDITFRYSYFPFLKAIIYNSSSEGKFGWAVHNYDMVEVAEKINLFFFHSGLGVSSLPTACGVCLLYEVL
jgi:hypothetical protein